MGKYDEKQRDHHNEDQSTPRKVYEAPTANLVPLKIEERLLTCGKIKGVCDAAVPNAGNKS